MAETINFSEAVLDKKLDRYSFEADNYIAANEITVTITLNEYRDLVKKNAVADSTIDKIRSEGYKKDSEIKQLKETINHLKDIIAGTADEEEENNA